MSIATAISNAQGKVADAYTAVSNKGGTLPAAQNLSNLPTAINSISSVDVVIEKATLFHQRSGSGSSTTYASAWSALLVSGTQAPTNVTTISLPNNVLNKNNAVSLSSLSSGTYTIWASVGPSTVMNLQKSATIII